ncbi:hypothetical protein K1T73_12275 [Roseovarius sp. SCSIO 43702]|uniref:hypothetical protein n=1 Tax=Roseovarius sp. SCSIO 43702 TaxID=2823043 RepID=UPI001C7321BE|nr:hypothetical protein [Roseovarius sp. SCSIO 43702]QYX58629.1 hypothetical protein K1T73_12275 [Roseovarius sp. SCSIO 43702]
MTPIPPRDPRTVMRLARMGSLHQCRLSFMRTLLRRLKSDAWRFETTAFEIDAKGVGHAVYTAHGPRHSYSLVAFAHDLPADQRSDRVIATAWDATFALFDGIPSDADIARLRQNVPRQEAGRLSDRELSLSRANRSVRLWDHVVDALAQGHQPDAARIREVGYLMRTTAVYGSGKFGAADREQSGRREECRGPFQVEMLSVYLTRAFVMDLVEHMARMRAPETAVPLAPALRRTFGIGNSTGLGMAPFLMNHPVLINHWMAAREEAIARVRSLPTATEDEARAFRDYAARARLHAEDWTSDHPVQVSRIADLRADMAHLAAHLQTADLTTDRPWQRLWQWAEDRCSLEGQEQVASLLMEPYGHLVDGLTSCMDADEQEVMRIDGAMRTPALLALTRDIYDWALALDWSNPNTQARLWYVSEAKLEPRLAERAEEPLEPYEQPLCPGRDAARMYDDLKDVPDTTVAEFLLRHPEHRHIVRRAQIAGRYPYAEIRDNTIDAGLMPIDLLRAKLSFFGACHFDPRSDRWLRITMFQHAPFPDELATGNADDWTYPYLPEAAQ